MKVLGIETSCDETGVAIYDTEQNALLADQLYSQVKLHAEYGGVVPELASRDHIQKTTPLIKQALKEANLDFKDLDGIAYTSGPGLIGALMVGASIGRSLAWSLDIPAVAVHHMEGHLLAPMLEDPAPQLPFVALLVSGGHTLLVDVKAIGDYSIMGESLDDAVGEAFDKTAKMMGLGAILRIISLLTILPADTPRKASASTNASAKVRLSVSIARRSIYLFIPSVRPL